jgi:hypothetical protein
LHSFSQAEKIRECDGETVMEGERISWKLVHDIVIKMSALASNIRFYPKKMINSSFISNLGKCFESGTLIIRCYIDGEGLEDLEARVRDFNVGYKLLMEALER